MIRMIKANGDAIEVTTVDQIQATTMEPASWIWLDIESSSVEDTRDLLRPLLDDQLITEVGDTRLPGRFLRHENWHLLRLKGLDADTTDLDFGTQPIVALFSDQLLITIHPETSVSIDELIESLGSQLPLPGTMLELALRIADHVVGRFLPIIMQLEGRLETLEEQLFARPTDELLTEIVWYRTSLRRLRRFIAYHQSAYTDMQQQLQSSEDRISKQLLRHTQRTLEREMSLCTLYYELCEDLADGYISLASHHMNSIMKVLTMVTVIFIPLSLLAGIYGMNFATMPGLEGQYAFYTVLGVMLVMAIIIGGLFYWRKWL
ncbi:MAG: magnesium/cobalt transporter CorA [Wenzhouxiangellaceae bacterium]